MSLFATSFSTGEAGPSYQSTSTPGTGKKTNTQKRKRPSLGDGKDGQIKNTEANLQKLMKRVEGGERKKGKGKGNGEGGETIGFVGKKRVRGRKSGGVDEGDEMDMDMEVSTPNIKSKNKNGDKNVGTDSPAPGKKQKANKSTPSEETPQKAKGGSKVEPAELPLPHTIRPDDKSDQAEGLTKMQRDMKAKLEGARFR
jgi:ribosomal RNA-processing protein 8